MSIRATNVLVFSLLLNWLRLLKPCVSSRYEEKSLGVYSEAPPHQDEEPDLSKESRNERISKYLKWHLQYVLYCRSLI
jgi:hypothetical protein